MIVTSLRIIVGETAVITESILKKETSNAAECKRVIIAGQPRTVDCGTILALIVSRHKEAI